MRRERRLLPRTRPPARGKPAVALPGPDSIVRASDRLAVFGANQDIARLETLFGTESGETDAIG